MQLQLYSVLPDLRPYVKVICTMECDEDCDTNHIRVLPDTCVEIFVNYTSTPVAMIGQELHHRSIVTFRANKPMDVQMRKGAGCVAICFYSGMAYPFFRIPMSDFSNSTTLLAELWKDKAGALETELAYAVSNEQRVLIVQNFLMENLMQSGNVIPIVSLLHQQPTGESSRVSTLSRVAGYSERQLSRKFQQQVGMSTVQYIRMSKFIRSLNLLKSHPQYSLTELAYKSGYYDQAHFVHDYKNYAGLTPGALLKADNVLY